MEQLYEPLSNYYEEKDNPAYFVQFAGFWGRFFAYLIDAFILAVPTFIINYILEGSLTNVSWSTRLITGAVGLLYFTLQESGPRQATVGKHLLEIKVADEYGRRINFGKALLRYLSKFLSAIILFIGFIMAGFTARRQALHDMIAGTLVVSENSFKNSIREQ